MSCVHGSGKPATNVRILWIPVWKARKSGMHCHRILRTIRESSRNTFTVSKRASTGVTRDVGGAGKPVPSADAWHWRAVRSARKRQVTGRVWRGATRPGPLRLIHGGDLVLFSAAPAIRPGQKHPQGPEFRSRRRFAGHRGGLSSAIGARSSAIYPPGEQAAAALFLTALAQSGEARRRTSRVPLRTPRRRIRIATPAAGTGSRARPARRQPHPRARHVVKGHRGRCPPLARPAARWPPQR